MSMFSIVDDAFLDPLGVEIDPGVAHRIDLAFQSPREETHLDEASPFFVVDVFRQRTEESGAPIADQILLFGIGWCSGAHVRTWTSENLIFKQDIITLLFRQKGHIKDLHHLSYHIERTGYVVTEAMTSHVTGKQADGVDVGTQLNGPLQENQCHVVVPIISITFLYHHLPYAQSLTRSCHYCTIQITFPIDVIGC